MEFDEWGPENPEPQHSKRSHRMRRLSSILIISGVIVGVLPLGTVAYGAISQWTLQNDWNNSIAAESVAQEAVANQGLHSDLEDYVFSTDPIDLPSASGNGELPKTKIFIPKIGVDQVVVEGSSAEALKNGPGHYNGMALPGERGNVGIAGHRVTWTKPFNRLDELSPGDLIILETVDKRYEYKVVESVVLDPKDTSMLRPTQDSRVTLTTCNPKFSARTRLDVQGVLTNTVDKNPTVVRVLGGIKEGIQAALGSSDNEPRADTFAVLTEEELLLAKTEDSPDDPTPYMHLGVLMLDEDRPTEAIEQFSTVIELSPENALGHFYLGLAHAESGSPSEAITNYRTAISINPLLEPALHQVGKQLLNERRYPEAIEMFDRAIAVRPLEAQNYLLLGRAQEASGNLEAATDAYSTVLKYTPDDEDAVKGLERLGIILGD